MMIFGYEVGSTKVVVIGRSNWVQDPRGTHRVQKRVQKDSVWVCSLLALSVAARVITFLSQRCEFFGK